MPDLTAFATSMAARLAPGGRILIADHHPIWKVLSVRGRNHLTVTADYFACTTPRATIDNPKLPTGARDNPDAPSFAAFIWPPSDILTALLAAGLTLTTFQESPAPELYTGLGPAADHLPATYLIAATRDVSHETSR